MSVLVNPPEWGNEVTFFTPNSEQSVDDTILLCLSQSEVSDFIAPSISSIPGLQSMHTKQKQVVLGTHVINEWKQILGIALEILYWTNQDLKMRFICPNWNLHSRHMFRIRARLWRGAQMQAKWPYLERHLLPAYFSKVSKRLPLKTSHG